MSFEVGVTHRTVFTVADERVVVLRLRHVSQDVLLEGDL